MQRLSLCLSIVLAFAVAGCKSGDAPSAATSESTPSVAENGRETNVLAPAAYPYDALPEAVRGHLDEKFTGDFDEMVKRRVIRAGVGRERPYTHTWREPRGVRLMSEKNCRLRIRAWRGTPSNRGTGCSCGS